MAPEQFETEGGENIGKYNKNQVVGAEEEQPCCERKLKISLM